MLMLMLINCKENVFSGHGSGRQYKTYREEAVVTHKSVTALPKGALYITITPMLIKLLYRKHDGCRLCSQYASIMFIQTIDYWNKIVFHQAPF